MLKFYFHGPAFYTGGYKYQLKEPLSVRIPALEKYGEIQYDFIKLSAGILTMLKGFASDGPSGLTIDTPSSMRGAFVHDAIYRLIRQKLLPPEIKGFADELLRDMCINDGMWKPRANYWYKAVDKFADAAADPRNAAKIKIAP